MRDGQHRAGVVREVLFQPQDALRVEVVGGLVEQEQIGLAQQELAQRDPSPLPTGKGGDRRIGRRTPQSVHRLLELGVELPRVVVVEDLLELTHLLHQLVGVVGGHQLGDRVVAVELLLDLAEPLLDVAEDCLLLVERRLLLEDADRRTGLDVGLAVVRLIQSRHDLQDARLAGPVGTDHADLRARQEVQRHVVEDDLVAVGLADLQHAVDELCHAHDGSCVGFRPDGRLCRLQAAGAGFPPRRRTRPRGPAPSISGVTVRRVGPTVVLQPAPPDAHGSWRTVCPRTESATTAAVHHCRSGPTVSPPSRSLRCTPSFSYSRVRSRPARSPDRRTAVTGTRARRARQQTTVRNSREPSTHCWEPRSKRRSVLASRNVAFTLPSLKSLRVTAVANRPTIVIVVSYMRTPRSCGLAPPETPSVLHTQKSQQRHIATCGQPRGHVNNCGRDGARRPCPVRAPRFAHLADGVASSQKVERL